MLGSRAARWAAVGRRRIPAGRRRRSVPRRHRAASAAARRGGTSRPRPGQRRRPQRGPAQLAASPPLRRRGLGRVAARPDRRGGLQQQRRLDRRLARGRHGAALAADVGQRPAGRIARRTRRRPGARRRRPRRSAGLPHQGGGQRRGAVGDILGPGPPPMPAAKSAIPRLSAGSISAVSRSWVSKATRVMNSSGLPWASSGAASATASSSGSTQVSTLAKLPSTWPAPGPCGRDGRCRAGRARNPACRAPAACRAARYGPAAPPPRFTRTLPGTRSSSSWKAQMSCGGILWKAAAG